MYEFRTDISTIQKATTGGGTQGREIGHKEKEQKEQQH